jgi:hypothetical protein
LVELLPNEPRTPRKGGSAAALLADPMSALNVAKNLALCRALFAAFDQPTIGAADPAPARPIYWLARAAVAEAADADRCPGRLAAYDYTRAAHLHRLLGLVSAGPFLVIERADPAGAGRVAAVLDLARARPDHIDALIGYFRAALLEAEDSWAPALYQRPQAEPALRRRVLSGLAAIQAAPRPTCSTAAERPAEPGRSNTPGPPTKSRNQR